MRGLLVRFMDRSKIELDVDSMNVVYARGPGRGWPIAQAAMVPVLIVVVKLMGRTSGDAPMIIESRSIRLRVPFDDGAEFRATPDGRFSFTTADRASRAAFCAQSPKYTSQRVQVLLFIARFKSRSDFVSTNWPIRLTENTLVSWHSSRSLGDNGMKNITPAEAIPKDTEFRDLVLDLFRGPGVGNRLSPLAAHWRWLK